MARHYGTPASFRRALTDRLKDAARAGRWALPHLQRQVAYDRLLQRLYRADDRWVLKGATALIARDLGSRATIDIDLYRLNSHERAERDLREAANLDLEDWFRFELGSARPLDGGGVRIPTTAVLGATAWARFHVDIVEGEQGMTGEPDAVPPLACISMPDLDQLHTYLAYPLADHVADKVVATFQRYGEQGLVSTRFKDLVDLVTIAGGVSILSGPLRTALDAESRRRRVQLPASFTIPDRSLWTSGYAAEARRSVIELPATVDTALEVVRPFLDPLLNGSATGRWDPARRTWS